MVLNHEMQRQLEHFDSIVFAVRFIYCKLFSDGVFSADVISQLVCDCLMLPEELQVNVTWCSRLVIAR